MILRAKNLCLLALKFRDAIVLLIPIMRRASFYSTKQILQKIEGASKKNSRERVPTSEGVCCRSRDR